MSDSDPEKAPSLRELSEIETLSPEDLRLIEESRRHLAEHGVDEERQDDIDNGFHTPYIMDVERGMGRELPPPVARAVGMGHLAFEQFEGAETLTDEQLMAMVEAHEAGVESDRDSEYITVKSRTAMTIGIQMGTARREERMNARLRVRMIEPDPEESLETVKPRPELVAEMVTGRRKGQVWPVASIHRGEITMFDPLSENPAETHPVKGFGENIFAVVAKPNGKMNVYEVVEPRNG